MTLARPTLVPVKVADLRLDATYVTPSGRLCRLALPPKSGPGSNGLSFLFDYLPAAGSQALVEPDGFRLSRENVPLLRQVRL